MTINNQPQGGMHPEDKRNLIVFFLCCIAAFVLYDIFIQQPHMKAVAEAQKIEAAKIQAAAVPTAANQEPAVLPLKDAIAKSARIPIENPDLLGSINLQGGRIDDLSLRTYFTAVDKSEPVRLLAPAKTDHPLYLEFGMLPAVGGGIVAVPDQSTVWALKAGSVGTLSKDQPVTLTWSNGAGLIFERTIALDAHYMFTITDTVRNNTQQPVTLAPYALVTRQGMPADFVANAVQHEGPIARLDGKLHEVKYKDMEKTPSQSFMVEGQAWAGFTDKYWFTGLMPPKDTPLNVRITRTDGQPQSYYQVDMARSPQVVAPGASLTSEFRAFVGPKKLSLLNEYADTQGIDRFDLVIDFGMFWFLTIPFFHILTWLGHATGSFAVAILVFTVILRLAVFPLANKSYRAFARMRKIQPQMLEIREKYADDRMKLQQAIFDLYKKEEVNPMAGCLPLLIQIPIFFALYKTLYVTLEMRHAPFWGWIADMSAPDPTSVFNVFGLVSWSPPLFLMIGAWPVIMGMTLFLQQRLNPPMQDPIQAKIFAFMPFMMVFLMAHFPAGLVIYWSWSNLLSIVQQYVLMRQEGVTVSFFRKSDKDLAMEKAVNEGPDVHPTLEALSHLGDDDSTTQRPISPPKKGKKGRK